jgi:TNF receptor-associated protein 1
LAESSPYFEALKQKDVEVLFCYEPYDELVLMQLRQFDSHNLTSVEKEMRQDRESDDLTDLGKYWVPTEVKLERQQIHYSSSHNM